METILKWLRANQRPLLAVLIALAGGGGVVIALDTGAGNGTTSPVTVAVNARPGDGHPTATITVPQAAVQQAQASLERDLETTPATTPPEQVQAAQRQAAAVKATQAALPTAGASQGFAGCVTRFVVNQSSRHGVRPQDITLHYTVSPNRPGWSDINAVVAEFNTPSFAASSNFVIDSEGHCALLVPIEAKAWTQAAGNPMSISFEIIDMGTESRYLAPAGLAKLRQVVREIHQRTGIPLRRGAVSNCTVTRTGIVQHLDWGLCGGGHGDIAPFALQPIIDYITQPTTPLTAGEQKIVHGIRSPKGTGHSRRYWCARDRTRRAAILHAARATHGGWAVRARGRRYQLLSRACPRT